MFENIQIILMILTVKELLGEITEYNPCDGDWSFNPHSRRCYRLIDTDTKWPAGELACAFRGSHHISVHSPEENQFIREISKGLGAIWLGAAEFGNATEYVWTDGTPFDFQTWQYGVRPPYHRGKKCVKMNTRTGEWFQSCCKVPSPFICVKYAVY
ncbi:hypothetical protein AB6A40_001815 [Gnathostoma spinigerum]|uniref:C-type lectin domain-containing protein n=1 Tax=Gnathostoma spinigerum TaxID=75299 RepID=A0ABD6E7H0_9BILA